MVPSQGMARGSAGYPCGPALADFRDRRAGLEKFWLVFETHPCGCRQEKVVDPSVSSQHHREQRFQALYGAIYVDLLRFVRRRVDPTHAEDVVGDVMLVAWRRLDDVPADLSLARAWLFGVAHKTLQNTRRREGKQGAVAVRLADVAPASANAGQFPDALAHRVDIAAAWPRLSAVHQEAIVLAVLAVLDGLTGPEAALVLGISPAAFASGCLGPGDPCGVTSSPHFPMVACPVTSLP